MPRRARLRVAGLPLHLIQRGNNRSACFYADEDYALYLRHLDELSRKFRCAVHAYVLMTNHVHLLLTPVRKDGPSLLMKHLGQRYVQYINKTYRRSGTLWEGRFRSSIVQEQGYLLRCYRYIELNPVRAAMVKHPRDYPWTSYSANAEGKPSQLLRPHEEYLALGRQDKDRLAAYRALFRSELDTKELEEIRIAVNGGFALGNARFKQEIAAMLGRRVEPGISGRPKKSSKRSTEARLGL
jgi:REP-associated tyrosine transposase